MPLLRDDGSIEEVEVALTNTVMMQCITWKRYEKDVLKKREEILNSSDKEVDDDEGRTC